jgi:hypothetical protein
VVAAASGADLPGTVRAAFSVAYADQSERDYELLVKAVRAGKLDVYVEEDSA